MNLFATVLTYPAPSANYRGESELNRTIIQKITDGRFDYPIISPEAMRNALREILAGKYQLPCNRERLHDEEQLAVKFKSLPHPEEFVDDFFFGYLVAAGKDDRRKFKQQVILNEADGRGASIRGKLTALLGQLKVQNSEGKNDEEESKKRNKKLQDQINVLLDSFTDLVFKRDSVLRMNLAKALEPYRFNTVFTQSPLSVKESAYQNSDSSALLYRETAVTAFQYPFALNLNDCKRKADWTRSLLNAIGELNDVAGNHARSYFEMAPASIVVRLTESLVAGYETYGFKKLKDRETYSFSEVIEGVLQDPPDYLGSEFYLGGRLVKEMDATTLEKLKARGVTLDRDPRRLLNLVAEKALA